MKKYIFSLPSVFFYPSQFLSQDVYKPTKLHQLSAMPTGKKKSWRHAKNPDGTSEFRTQDLFIPSPTLCRCATLAWLMLMTTVD